MRALSIAAGFLIAAGAAFTGGRETFIGSVAAKPEPPVARAVLMRNEIEFTGDRATDGASASLIALDGRVYVLTAKHLLGPAMGVEPTVSPSRFDDELVHWRVMPNRFFYGAADDPFVVSVVAMHRPDDNLDFDLIVLETALSEAAAAGRVVPLSNAAASAGDAVVVLGCPYAEGGACVQNRYPARVTAVQDGAYFVMAFQGERPVLNGFSGAPVLSADGEIVGVLGGAANGDAGAWATPIPGWLRAHGR